MGSTVPAVERAIKRATCAVDAMFGTGFRGALADDAEFVAAQFSETGVPVVAIDIPSGVHGLTGEMQGLAVQAHATVTFAALKPGLLFPPGRHLAGEVEVADIGIDIGKPTIGVTDRDELAGLGWRWASAHKWESGLMVVGGSAGMTGAPLMVSQAGMRAGAGIVWCCIPGGAGGAPAAGTEVITKDIIEITDALEHVERFKALVVGPGLGRDERIAAGVRELVAKAPVPVVLDADGLNALAGDLAPLEARRDPTVVTPHEGEYERLAGEPVGADRIAAARSPRGANRRDGAAQRTGHGDRGTERVHVRQPDRRPVARDRRYRRRALRDRRGLRRRRGRRPPRCGRGCMGAWTSRRPGRTRRAGRE